MHHEWIPEHAQFGEDLLRGISGPFGDRCRRPGADPSQGCCFTPTAAAQYTSAQHARLAKRHGVRLSLTRRGQCRDNAVAESLFATIKTELLHRQPWPTRTTARQAIFEYVEGWYNTRRRHSSLGYLSPTAYEAGATNPLPLRKVT